jgi:hypothetical protein
MLFTKLILYDYKQTSQCYPHIRDVPHNFLPTHESSMLHKPVQSTHEHEFLLFLDIQLLSKKKMDGQTTPARLTTLGKNDVFFPAASS